MRTRWMQLFAAAVGADEALPRNTVADAQDREFEPEEDRLRESADWRPAALRIRGARRRAAFRNGTRPARQPVYRTCGKVCCS